MNTEQRIEKLIHQIYECIGKYKLNPSSVYLYDFERYKVMGETILDFPMENYFHKKLEKHSYQQLEHLVEVELPRLIRDASQL